MAVLHLLQPLFRRLPVDDLPNSLEVFSLPVLVLPGIDAQNGTELADDEVLVCIRLDADLARLHILHKPGPAASLDAGQSGVEFLLECVRAAVALVDGTRKLASQWLAAAL